MTNSNAEHIGNSKDDPNSISSDAEMEAEQETNNNSDLDELYSDFETGSYAKHSNCSFFISLTFWFIFRLLEYNQIDGELDKIMNLMDRLQQQNDSIFENAKNLLQEIRSSSSQEN